MSSGSVVEENVVGFNGGDGIVIYSRPEVKGNLVGTDPAGNPMGNDGFGIKLVNGTVGGLLPGDGNVVAFNGQGGIKVTTNLELQATADFVYDPLSPGTGVASCCGTSGSRSSASRGRGPASRCCG